MRLQNTTAAQDRAIADAREMDILTFDIEVVRALTSIVSDLDLAISKLREQLAIANGTKDNLEQRLAIANSLLEKADLGKV